MRWIAGVQVPHGRGYRAGGRGEVRNPAAIIAGDAGTLFHPASRPGPATADGPGGQGMTFGRDGSGTDRCSGHRICLCCRMQEEKGSGQDSWIEDRVRAVRREIMQVCGIPPVHAGHIRRRGVMSCRCRDRGRPPGRVGTTGRGCHGRPGEALSQAVDAYPVSGCRWSASGRWRRRRLGAEIVVATGAVGAGAITGGGRKSGGPPDRRRAIASRSITLVPCGDVRSVRREVRAVCPRGFPGLRSVSGRRSRSASRGSGVAARRCGLRRGGRTRRGRCRRAFVFGRFGRTSGLGAFVSSVIPKYFDVS